VNEDEVNDKMAIRRVRLSNALTRRFVIGSWEDVRVKDGVLAISSPDDQCSAVYAPGAWQSVEEIA
jgi:hypothetical protein